MITLQNLVTADHSKNGENKYDRKQAKSMW